MAKHADIDDLGSRYGCDGMGDVNVDGDHGVALRLKIEPVDGDDGDDGESGRVYLTVVKAVEDGWIEGE
jgi:hypothetical protein